MAMLDKLVPASFKGYPFWVTAENVPSLGRRVVIHDFVNSGERYAEDLGSIPQDFEIDAFIHGEDWYQRGKGFETVLNEEGPGELFLPSVGKVTVYAMPYSRSVAQASYGMVTYKLKFTRGRTIAGPSLAEIDEQTVYDRGFTAREAMESQFSLYSTAPKTAANFSVFSSDALSSVENAVSELENSIPVDQIIAVTSAAANIYRNVSELIQDPAGFAAELLGEAGLWSAISQGLWVGNSGVGLSGALSGLLRLVSFGSGLALQLSSIYRASADYSTTSSSAYAIPLWPETTYERQLRNANRLALVRATRLAALVTAYEVAAAQTYQTDDQLTAARSALEDAHEQIMRVDVSNSDVLQADPTVRTAIESLRLAALSVLDSKQATTYSVGEVSINRPTSSLLTSYSLYAEDFATADDMVSSAQGVRDLNPSLPSGRLSGAVSVFTGG